jgi:4-aminobutyrate aminotransferase-like enzyme
MPRRPALLGGMLAPGERPGTYVKSGRGTRLTLADGREVIDGGSMSSCVVGHCHPAVVSAVQRAAESVYVNDTTGWAPREAAAQDLLEVAFAGEPWADMVAFFVSASEANELGLLLAQELTGRAGLVCRELSYHGCAGLARSVSSHPLWSASLAAESDGATVVAPNPEDVRRLAVPVCGLGEVPPSHRCIDSCLAGAETQLAGAAAVIVDYSQGCVCPSAQWQDTLAAQARAAGTLWIADETVTGFGRLGHGFAFQRGASRPDVVGLGKGISGGAVAAGALVLSREVVERIDNRRWTTSATYRGNPLAAAAISATMGVLRNEGLIERAASLGETFGRDVKEVARRHPSVERVVGDGMLWVIQLRTDAGHTEHAWRGSGRSVLPATVQSAAIDHGAYIGVQSGQSVWTIPPLIISELEVEQIVDALDRGLGAADRVFEAARAA